MQRHDDDPSPKQLLVIGAAPNNGGQTVELDAKRILRANQKRNYASALCFVAGRLACRWPASGLRHPGATESGQDVLHMRDRGLHVRARITF